MSFFDPKTNEEHVREFDEHIRGDKGLIGFTTQDGKKHVGWYYTFDFFKCLDNSISVYWFPLQSCMFVLCI